MTQKAKKNTNKRNAKYGGDEVCFDGAAGFSATGGAGGGADDPGSGDGGGVCRPAEKGSPIRAGVKPQVGTGVWGISTRASCVRETVQKFTEETCAAGPCRVA